MCDYSLGLVASRPAKVNDKLICTTFRGTATLGMASVDDPATAVCLMPGTELAFEEGIKYRTGFLGIFSRRAPSSVARFCQVNTHDVHTHHDALELVDGRVISLQQLAVGQKATVLQLPAQPHPGHSHRNTESASAPVTEIIPLVP
jgi:hypothetical protein